MKGIRNIISENTGVSISLMIAVIGFVIWLTNLNATASVTAKDVSKLQTTQERIDQAISDIRDRLSRIEEKTDRILKRR